MKKAGKVAYLKPAKAEMGVVADEGDLNMFEIDFGSAKQAEEEHLSEVEPILCGSCQVMLNNYSRVLTPAEYDLALKDGRFPGKDLDMDVPIRGKALLLKPGEAAWVCEYCFNHNVVPFAYKEIKPTEKDVVLVVQAEVKKAVQQTLVFCIDLSGSMNVTSEFKGDAKKLKFGMLDSELEMLKAFMDP
jgi:hypothetical protein